MLLWGNVTPALAQHINCCMRLIDVKGKWVGALRSCDLSNTPPESRERAEICQILKGCEEAAKYCSATPPSQSSRSPSPGQGQSKEPPGSRSSGRR